MHPSTPRPDPRPRRVRALVATCLVGGLAPWAIGTGAAHAASPDRDHDGMPTRWEVRHGLDPRVANARADRDGDGLSDLAEYRYRSDPRDEDTDGDGHDDGDEVRDGFRSTSLLVADTDGDGIPDGDEDADRDGVANEDEDDAREPCRLDDDDRDRDHVDDEDENEQGTSWRDADSDDDGVPDGDEDADEDGEANEDEDDDAGDLCGSPREDDGDLLGTISAFDATSGVLGIESVGARTLSFVVTDETEIEVEGSDRDGSAADLVVGAAVAEVEVDGRTGTLEKVELYADGYPGEDDSDGDDD